MFILKFAVEEHFDEGDEVGSMDIDNVCRTDVDLRRLHRYSIISIMPFNNL